jgi:hypothetical protein
LLLQSPFKGELFCNCPASLFKDIDQRGSVRIRIGDKQEGFGPEEHPAERKFWDIYPVYYGDGMYTRGEFISVEKNHLLSFLQQLTEKNKTLIEHPYFFSSRYFELGEIKPVATNRPWKVITELPPDVIDQRNALLAEADVKIRLGLAALAEEFPQLKKARDYENVISGESGKGRISIWLCHTHKGKGQTTKKPVPEDEQSNVLVIIQPPPEEITAMHMGNLYPRLGLVGQIGTTAGAPELDAALKKLVWESLKPLKKLDESVGNKKTAVQVDGESDKYNLMARGGKGWVEVLDPNAANLIRQYLRALEKSDWKTALSVCSINVKDKAQQYPTPESFFNTVVPVKEILNNPRDPQIGSWKYSAYIFDVGISRPDMPRVVSWQWKARKLEGRANWEIDFPAIPFETWLANEKQVTIRAIKESEQLTKEMAPRLKGVRTLLTAKREEFVVGEPIYFCLQIINQGDSILNYDCQQVAVNNSMTIEGPDGKEVKYTAESVQTAGGPVLLKPGVTKTLFDQLDITKQYDMRQQGQYRVQFNGNGLSFVVGKEDIFELSDPKSWRYYRSILPSNVVAITIHSDIKQETLDVRKDGVEDEKAVSQTNTEDKRDVQFEGAEDWGEAAEGEHLGQIRMWVVNIDYNYCGKGNDQFSRFAAVLVCNSSW